MVTLYMPQLLPLFFKPWNDLKKWVIDFQDIIMSKTMPLTYMSKRTIKISIVCMVICNTFFLQNAVANINEKDKVKLLNDNTDSLTDNTLPTSSIGYPLSNVITNLALPLKIAGIASDSSGITRVEVSLDGGTTWGIAIGTTIWNYNWTPTVAGLYTIKTRAYDSAGNVQPIIGAGSSSVTIQVEGLPNPNNGGGGPILVISNASNPFSRYAVEILRAEGLNEFNALDISVIDSNLLKAYDVIILGEMALNPRQVEMFTAWTDAGGTFISFRPDAQLAPLLGLTKVLGILSDKYLTINANGPGIGIVNQSMQFHGDADFYTLNGATALASLYSDANTALLNPGITVNNRLNNGKAVAFTYDLAKSIVYTRQGNPAWAGQKRDGMGSIIRTDDMFYPDYVDFNKIAIPQADEQQRMLANIIIQYNLNKKPLPRLWYLPRGLKAAVVMTGDDHNNPEDMKSKKTADYFNLFKSLSPSNTPDAVADWYAIRGTSYTYFNTPISNKQGFDYEAAGFEISIHLTNSCATWTPISLSNVFNTQLPGLHTRLPSISFSSTHRIHCLTWSDWASLPKIEQQRGIRLNTSYYYWPGSWVLNRPGMFTGSGFPMRFADTDGSLIDNYQLTTQMPDESDLTITSFCSQLLDKALGKEGYYGTFCVNWHTDNPIDTGAIGIINAAKQRNVPVIAAKQLLTWLDGRNNTTFENVSWTNNTLHFTITKGARNLEAMVPVNGSGNNQLVSINTNGENIVYRTETIKGITYAFFTALPATYHAVYELSSTVTITAPLNNDTLRAPANIVITANAKDLNTNIQNVKFYSNDTLLIGIDSTAPYSFTWANVAIGNYTITAKSTNNNGLITSSTPVLIKVINTAPTVSISTPLNNSTFNAPANVIITANAADVNDNITYVQFYNGTTLLGTDSVAPYAFTWANVGVGNYVIITKVKDNAGAVVTSTAVAITVINTAPTISLTSPINNASFNAPANIIIAANAADVNGTVSNVQYYNGTTRLGVDSIAPYSFTWSNVAIGNYSITAKATDNNGAVTTSTAVLVSVLNTAPTISLTSPLNNSTFNAPANVIITANAADVNGTVTNVQYYNGTALLGSDATAPYSFTWSNVAIGNYSITAKATDNNGSVTTSAPITIAVINTPPTVSLSSPANNTTYLAPASITVTANAADANGTVANVQFYNGSILLGSDATAPYSFSWTNVAVGTYTITAKAIDNIGAVTTSTSITVTVAPIIAGPDCASINTTVTYQLNPAKRTNVINYGWWFVGVVTSTTMVIGTPYQAVLKTGPYFTGGQICVGTNLSVSPWYVSYCKTVNRCGTLTLASKETASLTNIATPKKETVSITSIVTPNPTVSSFTITAPEEVKMYTVSDMIGNVIIKGKAIGKGASVQIGSMLKPGIYVLNLVLQNGQIQTKGIQKK